MELPELFNICKEMVIKPKKRKVYIPDDPVGHGGGRFPLVGPVLRFTLEQDPVFLDRTQAPCSGPGPFCSPPALVDKGELF